MRRIGSWLMVLFSLGALAGMYFVTPYLSHVQSHVLQFLSVVAAAIALVICLTLLIGGVMMRSGKMPQPKRVAVPVPPVAPVTPSIEHELALIDSHVKQARSYPETTNDLFTANQRIDHLAVAVESLVVMLKRRAGLK